MLTGFGVLALLVVLGAGAIYGYLRYRFDQLPKLNITALERAAG